MLDLFGIMFSSLMMVVVIVRAVQLDRTLPWFEISSPKRPHRQPGFNARPSAAPQVPVWRKKT